MNNRSSILDIDLYSGHDVVKHYGKFDTHGRKTFNILTQVTQIAKSRGLSWEPTTATRKKLISVIDYFP